MTIKSAISGIGQYFKSVAQDLVRDLKWGSKGFPSERPSQTQQILDEMGTQGIDLNAQADEDGDILDVGLEHLRR